MNDTLLIFGSRGWSDWQTIARVLVPLPILLIEGEADGADTIARAIVVYRGGHYQPYPARWAKHGLAAGPLSDQEMLDMGRPSRAVGFIYGPVDSPWSRGSADMARRLVRAGVPIQIYRDGGVLEGEWDSVGGWCRP